MKFTILISILLVSVNCELAKQSSELNYIFTKRGANIISPILSEDASVNLVKYGPMAGQPIHTLSYGPNLVYQKPAFKPILNYGHYRNDKISSALDLPSDFELSYQSKKYSDPNSANEVMITPSDYHTTHSNNLNYLKANPAYNTIAGYQPTTSYYPYISDNHPFKSSNLLIHDKPRHLKSYHEQHNQFPNFFDSTPINYKYPISIVRYSDPISKSYLMKINHVAPNEKYHQTKTEIPFFEQKLLNKPSDPFVSNY